MASSPCLIKLIPILSDIFVFSYPVFLIVWYFYWTKISQHHSSLKSFWTNSKHQALSILGSFVAVVIVNIIIKLFVSQTRPFHTLSLASIPHDALILDRIPTDAFPSDHAAVSMVIAAMTLMRAYQTHNKKLRIFWRIFVLFALIMDISRITMWLHWPSDIIWGTLVALVVSVVLHDPSVKIFLFRYAYGPLIRLQEFMWTRIAKLKQ